jgi:hypothetical protein
MRSIDWYGSRLVTRLGPKWGFFFKNSIELYTDMTNDEPNIRPSCEEILNRREKWCLKWRSVAKICLNSFWGKFGQTQNMGSTEYVTNLARFYDLILDCRKVIFAIFKVSFEVLIDEMIEVQLQRSICWEWLQYKHLRCVIHNCKCQTEIVQDAWIFGRKSGIFRYLFSLVVY